MKFIFIILAFFFLNIFIHTPCKSQSINNKQAILTELPLLIEINYNNHKTPQYKEAIYIHSIAVDSISYGYKAIVTIRSLRGKSADTTFILNALQVNTINCFQANIKNGFSEEESKFAGWDAYYRIYISGKIIEYSLPNFYSLFNALIRKEELPWNK